MTWDIGRREALAGIGGSLLLRQRRPRGDAAIRRHAECGAGQ